ncbi:MAG: signal peptidase I [Planctomycetaceae bacterium]|nr:signal peptidase I [Planctomycetaceae bacterium]
MPKRQPFGTPDDSKRQPTAKSSPGPNKDKTRDLASYDNTMAGSFVLEPTFWDRISVRETIESIAMAIVLAFAFKTMQAEAYIIPTGSMAPTLMGQHIEVACPECEYYFQVGATFEGPSSRISETDRPKGRVIKVRCPLTFEIRDLARGNGAPLPLDKEGKKIDPRPNDESFAGDRIVVSKLDYLWGDPKRWDVIVFKYPGSAKDNYIKRLLGLPGETLTINNGDVYVQPTVSLDRNRSRTSTIARKPAQKLAQIAIPVQDSYHFSAAMRQAGLPPAWIPDTLPAADGNGPAWQHHRVASSEWKVKAEGTEPATYQINTTQSEPGKYDWLRFRHIVPRQAHWQAVRSNQPLPDNFLNSPGNLVTDYYCYNDAMLIRDNNRNWDAFRYGTNWVGDLMADAEVTVGPQGKLALDAVEGGVHFLCEIDVASGEATLSSSISVDGVQVQFVDLAQAAGAGQTSLKFPTPLRGAGSYKIRYANCDDRIYLWINDQEVAIPGDGCYLRTGKLRPYFHPQDYGDARPLGIGFQGGELSIQRLKVFRDFFYLTKDDFSNSMTSLRYRTGRALESLPALFQYYDDPIAWSRTEYQELYDVFDHDAPLNWDSAAFQLLEDQFFPMGDNSPQSEDARKWNARNYVERRFLIGRALMVYWPHTWNSPPFWPNFNRMRLIH